MEFRVKSNGNHDGQNLKAGQVIKSGYPLHEMFSFRFDLIDSTVKECLTVENQVVKESFTTEPEEKLYDTIELDGNDKDVTRYYKVADDVKIISKGAGWYDVYKQGELITEKAMRKRDLEKFVENFL